MVQLETQELELQEHFLNGDEEVVLIPFKREDVHWMKCLKFSDGELPRLEKFALYLATTKNPVTGHPLHTAPRVLGDDPFRHKPNLQIHGLAGRGGSPTGGPE